MKEYILSNAEAKLVDDYTINQLGIPGKQLMKTAGNFVTLKAKLFLKHLPGSRIDVFCGTGNNGGDGLVTAAELQDMGAFVKVWIIGDKRKIKGDALHFLEICEQENVSIDDVQSEKDLKKLATLHETDLIIDAMLGTGFRGNVKGITSTIIQLINQVEHPVKHPVLAVDIPSGINGDTGKVCGVAVKARKTVTMGFLKRGLLYNEGPKYAGEIILADLKYPDESYSVLESETYYYHKYDLVNVFPKIPYNAYKNLMGKVLVIAGSKGMTGAAYLTSMAAQRSGAGLVINALPESLNPIMETKLTEVMTLPVPESENQTFCAKSMNALEERINWASVIVFGPGVSADESVMDFGRELLKKTDTPIIIDADGLKIFNNNLDLLKSHPNLIITPHMGEFGRLVKKDPDDIRIDRIAFAKEFVKEYKCQLLLKGAHTISIKNDMTTAVNSTGNPALATGGSGDVLSGIIAGFIAQRIDKFDAVTAAMAVHGYAADIATREFGIRGLIASDLLKYLPMVLREFDTVGV